jgi:hypothetical protein
LREKERAKNQRTYGAVKQKVIPLDRGSNRARYQRTAQLSAMFVLGHGRDGICGDCHLKPSPLVLRLRAVFAHVPQTSSPFRTIFHRVEVPEQGDSVAPTHQKKRVPLSAPKKAPGQVPRLHAVNDCLQNLGITCRENQERQRATRHRASLW